MLLRLAIAVLLVALPGAAQVASPGRSRTRGAGQWPAP